MADMSDDLDGFEAQIAELETTLSGATSIAAAFQAELEGMQGAMLYTNREVQTMSRAIGGGLRRAFDGLVFDGMRLSDALRTVATSMIDAAYNAAMRPVQTAIGGVISSGINGLMSSILPFEKGGAFSGGRVTPFARGGVVSGPTPFAMRGGLGLMGEAGPEAIMPLTRGPDGRLGVQAAGGGRAVSVTMNITTPDVQGFRRSQSQIAAEMGRALARGQRNR
ncbi:phage tail tape measure protein [Roseibacterium beibuensis]|uniref:Phage tail tape measure protein n=1 Tax=[Roseibacterium] beibuensis TaxID=1193142 RepID=A0ABP9LIN3_9RHOB|nr:phage tail tape measure protein [Roseibacterium beibuensis]MCS6625792.1 phage tail tape measure protein [Roseibacterium beibuensis]